jgi:membrane protein YdbS with pleckstrin-like domain
MNDDEAPDGEPQAAESSAPGEPAPQPPAGVDLPEEGATAAPAPTVADGVERPLDPRAIRLARTVGWITVGVVGLCLLVPAALVVAFAPLPGWGQALIALPITVLLLVLVWSAQVWPAIEHRHAFYRVDREGIEIRRGVLWRVVIQVPRSRVQHTDVSQGPLERANGLGTLVIYTAGTAHAKVALAGIDHGTALAIRDHLLPEGGGDAV